MTSSMKTLLAGHPLPYRWTPGHRARGGLQPRDGTASDTIWCDVEPCYVFHPANACESDGRVILDAKRFDAEPRARITVPHRVLPGFHGNGIPARKARCGGCADTPLARRRGNRMAFDSAILPRPPGECRPMPGLRTVRMVLGALALAVSATAVRAVDTAAPVGADPVAAFAASAALEAEGRTRDAAALRRSLTERWLQRLEGQPPAAPATLRQLIDGAASVPPEREQARRWNQLVQQHLVAAPVSAPVALPPELEADAARLQSVAPGLWIQQAPDGSPRGAVWWLPLRHAAPAALGLDTFALEARVAGSEVRWVPRWRCALPRYAETALLPPGAPSPYLCRLSAADGVPPSILPAALAALARATSLQLHVDLEPAALAQAVRRLELAATRAAPAAAAEPTSASAGAARPAKGASAVRANAARPPTAPASARASRPASPSWLQVVQALSAAATAFVVYTLLHRIGGSVFAFGLTWMAGAALSLAGAARAIPGLHDGLGAGTQAALVLPLLGGLAAVVLPFFATVALALVHQWVFGDRQPLIRAAQRVAADSLQEALQRLVQRLMRRILRR